MATCSITDRIVINNPEFVDAYIDAMEARANAPFKPRTENHQVLETYRRTKIKGESR